MGNKGVQQDGACSVVVSVGPLGLTFVFLLNKPFTFKHHISFSGHQLDDFLKIGDTLRTGKNFELFSSFLLISIFMKKCAKFAPFPIKTIKKASSM
jgi:hypothetical protein